MKAFYLLGSAKKLWTYYIVGRSSGLMDQQRIIRPHKLFETVFFWSSGFCVSGRGRGCFLATLA